MYKAKGNVSGYVPPEDPSKNVNGGLSIISDLRDGYCCDVIAEGTLLN